MFPVRKEHGVEYPAEYGIKVYRRFDRGWHAHSRRFIGVEFYYGRMRRWFGLKDSN